MWDGNNYLDIANIVRFTPSACNSQPWYVKENNNELTIYRYQKPGKRGIMPKAMITYYNQIDIGIFLFILELCLDHNNIKYEKTVYTDKIGENNLYLTAKYAIINKGR